MSFFLALVLVAGRQNSVVDWNQDDLTWVDRLSLSHPSWKDGYAGSSNYYLAGNHWTRSGDILERNMDQATKQNEDQG